MTQHRSFKHLVRTRMAKTGESYTAARAILLAGGGASTVGPEAAGDGSTVRPEAAGDASTAGTAGGPGAAGAERPPLATSDAAIRERTGRGWEEWFDVLDGWGAADLPRREIGRRLAAELDLHPLAWNVQAIVSSFERARGLRAVGEHADGFSANSSRTVAVPVQRLYDAFLEEAAGDARVRTATPPRSARFDWGDGGERVHASFTARGDGAATVTVDHRRLADDARRAQAKAFWRDRLAALKARLEAAAPPRVAP